MDEQKIERGGIEYPALKMNPSIHRKEAAIYDIYRNTGKLSSPEAIALHHGLLTLRQERRPG